MIIPPEGYALLDAIALGESAGQYNVLYGGGHFTDYSAFPQWAGKDNSHAAGRYQFEPATWRGVVSAIGLPDFSPSSQDQGAWWLAQSDYKRRAAVDLLAALQSDLLVSVATSLKATWTSLSPTTLPSRYYAALAKRAAVVTAPSQIPTDEQMKMDIATAIAILQKYA